MRKQATAAWSTGPAAREASIANRAKQSGIPLISYGRLVANADIDY